MLNEAIMYGNLEDMMKAAGVTAEELFGATEGEE